MPPKKTTTTTETSVTTTPIGAGAGNATVAPTPVEAPQEAMKEKKGRKKKEVVQSETENETSNETADEESVDEEEESLDISVELSHVNELLMNINKNMKNADISNPLTQKIYIAFRDQSHKFEKTYLTLLAKASSKKGKATKEPRAPRNVDPEKMAVNQLHSVHPEILAFMGQPANQKLSRTDVQKFIYTLRSEDSFVKDETGAFLKKKPFYITKNDQLGRFFAIVRKIMTANGPQEADVQKGYIQQNGNLPEYIYSTSIFGYVAKVFVEDN
jgi:hypothetical protein